LSLFLVFCAFSTIAVYFLRGGLTQRALSLVAGTWGALWAMSSYFIPHSHPGIIPTLSPMLCVAIGLALYLLARYQKVDGWAMLVRTSFVPVLAVILTASFGNAAGLVNYLTSASYASYTVQQTDRAFPAAYTGGAPAIQAARHVGYEREINGRLPVMDESLLELLHAAQVGIDDPIVYVGDPKVGGILSARVVSDSSGEHLLSPPRTWLPTMPFALFDKLPDERKELYVSRFAERARLSGWLVQSKEEAPYGSLPWFSDPLQRTHTPTEVFENDDWRLTWFEFSG
jgi:hypothetical protein